MRKNRQKERILGDLLKGLHIDWFNNIGRYGTSCRSRISELRAEGYPIDDYFETSPNGARYKVYYISQENLKKLHGEVA